MPLAITVGFYFKEVNFTLVRTAYLQLPLSGDEEDGDCNVDDEADI